MRPHRAVARSLFTDTAEHAPPASARGARPSFDNRLGAGTRAPVNHKPQWPLHVHKALASLAAELIPRGRLFEKYIHDATEPRRSGVYEFCVVGVDLQSQPLRYHCWEPSGYFDRSFETETIEQQFAFRRCRRHLALPERGGSGASSNTVVRWPPEWVLDGLMYGRRLPEVDATGRPVLPGTSRFTPRTSTDLLGPMLLGWRRLAGILCDGVTTSDARLSDTGPLSLLVLDGTGRFARHLQSELPTFEITAVDEPPAAGPLRRFHDRDRLPVCRLNLGGRLAFSNRTFNVVVLPFAFRRLCNGEHRRLQDMVLEALRVASLHVLVADETDALLGCRSLGAPVLLEGDLQASPVPDDFLAPCTAAQAGRRFMIFGCGSNQLALREH